MRRINIRRIDNTTTGTHAWQVRISRNSCNATRTFSDGVYGGKRRALQAAISYREQLLAAVSNFEYQIQRRSIVRRNNKSGISGVGRYETMTNPNTRCVAVFWLASWLDEHGESRKRKFSVGRYGEQKARQLAIAERQRQLKRVCAAKSA